MISLLWSGTRLADLIKAISKAAGDMLEDVSLFDVYKGSQVPRV